MSVLKICGLRNTKGLSDFLSFPEVQFIGCVHYSKSKRNISLEEARDIFSTAKKFRPDIKTVLVVVNPTVQDITRMMAATRADIIQLSGTESPEMVNGLDLYNVWKTIHISDSKDLEKLKTYLYVENFLLDKKKEGFFGGTGEIFDWSVFQEARKNTSNLILSGGINPENIFQILTDINPAIIDVNSGVENEDLDKDVSKIEVLVQAIRSIKMK